MGSEKGQNHMYVTTHGREPIPGHRVRHWRKPINAYLATNWQSYSKSYKPRMNMHLCLVRFLPNKKLMAHISYIKSPQQTDCGEPAGCRLESSPAQLIW